MAQVDLLLQTLSHVAKETIYALKVGTAINLFIRIVPRLSVDIDLIYLPIDDRGTALNNISDGQAQIKFNLEQSIARINLTAAARHR